MNTYLAALAAVSLVGVGCTTQQTLYSNNGMTIVQVSADPGLTTRSFTLIVKEENGESTVITATKNRSIIETLAMPGALVGGALLVDAGDTNVSNGSNSSSGAGSSSSSNAGAISSSNSNSNAVSVSSATGGSGGIAPGNSGGQGGNGNNP